MGCNEGTSILLMMNVHRSYIETCCVPYISACCDVGMCGVCVSGVVCVCVLRARWYGVV